MAPRTRKKKETTPKQLVTGGFLLICLAVVAYFYIGHAEHTDGSITLPVIIVPVYKLLGKWGIVGILAVGGILSLVMGVHDLRKKPPVATQPVPAQAVPAQVAAAQAVPPGTVPVRTGDEIDGADSAQPPVTPAP